MSSNFVMIKGIGIFPTSGILGIMPYVGEQFCVSVEAPTVAVEDFKFYVTKRTTIDLTIYTTPIEPKKGEKVEKISDDQYSEVIEGSFELTEKEIQELLYGDEPDESISTAISNYKRRLKKKEDYDQRLNMVQANPDMPDYQSNLTALLKDDPGESYNKKQIKSLDRINSALQEKILEIVEKEDDDSDEPQHRVIEMFETDEHRDRINTETQKVLGNFYAENFSDHEIDDDAGGLSDFFERDSERRALEAENIRKNGTELTNIPDSSNFDNDDLTNE